MATSQTNYCPRQIAGLTLIEVLVALAIVSIAMTAIIKAVSQNIRSTDYLQNKTIATYVGQQVINEARVGIINLSKNMDKLNEKTMMLDRAWYWQAEETSTPNQRIKKITVRVFAHKSVGDDESPIVTLESYLYHE